MDRTKEFLDLYHNSFALGDIDPWVWLSQYIADRMELNSDQRCWFSFLQSVTYHLPTAYVILNEYPDLELAGISRLREWWTPEVQKMLPFQKDKLRQRKYLPETVESYKRVVRGSESSYFDSILSESPNENFYILWDKFYKEVDHWGRFSCWNFGQGLKHIASYPIEPDTLLLTLPGSDSHTKGLCHALGKDEWNFKRRWKDEEGKRKKESYKFSTKDREFLEAKAKSLMLSISNRSYVDSFSMETVCCEFHKLYRKGNSRYVGYYNDRIAEDINSVMDNWPGVDWRPLMEGRKELYDLDTIGIKVDKSKFKLTPEEKVYVECYRDNSSS